MAATTHLRPVPDTGVSTGGTAVVAPRRSRRHLALQVVLAVSLGVVAALLATWAVVSTMTLPMSF